ncbi:hypothetical protein PPTG_02031 [Phytophthora nicotianae INRA-310]|uniref:SWIM-type domain-containing protein n=1 Tax=Phytophthora nicotianae (strain INRA-310) TaxID=761204 RepID=W2R975_PHYN3|nr:hypothetical protein PPTG_02031 [Phytophthora nicotianae INRA-310]ETN21963.1 hypothetical protein PPTG_02031 [Phytophthora nicotianae INRA-310]
MEKREKILTKRKNAGHDVTPYAKKLFEEEKLRVAQQTVVCGEPPHFYVFDAFDSRTVGSSAHVYEVDMDLGTCSRCTTAEQMRIPCRHVEAVIFDRAKSKAKGLVQYDVRDFFHSAYLVPNLQKALESISVRLSLYNELSLTDNVKPPPNYRQAGRSSMHTRSVEALDIVRGSKRKQNRGEDASSSFCSGRIRSKPTPDITTDEETKNVSVFFDAQLSATSTKKREKILLHQMR